MAHPNMEEMISTLRHMMAHGNLQENFEAPSLLREVPSYTAPDTSYDLARVRYAGLEERTPANSY